MKIYVRTYDEYARVFVDDKQVKSFSLLAEDYAITLANNYASDLKKYNQPLKPTKRDVRLN